ncbi:acetyltransferase [Vibrio zhanjiangensis]|uniref:Acetyltransferase n=1 Tax=Vibrio zhanjiangensis TaxID=1046128 RepID=A0ABQ6F218_9VIBR|nr:acyltransferase [Vibrio zhanjiangensis]GLT18916.1 acetyltransferase [Vibrio zhanjiangensis]
MLAAQINDIKLWLKENPNPICRKLFCILKYIRACDLPTPSLLNKLISIIYTGVTTSSSALMRVFIYTPAFKGRLATYGKRLYLFGGVPLITGPLKLVVGDDCRISGHTTFSGRPQSRAPELIIGNNVDIGWQTTIAVGKQVVISDNVRMAGRAFLFGYSGHSLNAEQRAAGAGDKDQDVGSIILEKDVWLGTNVTVCPNVTIGQGTIVGAGSVVTKSLPPFVVAAGNPARIVRKLAEQEVL